MGIRMEIKLAALTDLDRIMDIYRHAQNDMIQSGNPDQWGHFYPDPELIKSDIENHECHIVCDNNEAHGVFALVSGPDPTYQIIEDGEWLNDDPYVVIHRLAGDGKIRGLFRCVLEYCKNISGNIRVDTHRNNLKMQALIEKYGFERCGTIYVNDGSPRIAYQKVMD